MRPWFDRFALLVATAMLLSCAESVHQARRLQSSGTFTADNGSATGQRDRALDLFSEVRTAPDRYRDRTVTWSGTVLSARRLSDRTEVEILHLPSSEGRPTENRRLSQGRFLAYQGELLDPATLLPGTPVTITGRLEGATTRPLESGADDYTYPMLAIMDLHTWPVSSVKTAPTALDAAGAAVESPGILGSLFQTLLAAVLNMLFSHEKNDVSTAPPASVSSSTPTSPDSSPAKPLPPQFQKSR